MSIETIRDLIPDYAKDIRQNLSILAGEDILTDQQKWGTFVVSALASRSQTVIKAVLAEATTHLDETAMTGAKAAAGIMAMNNVYYRFLHITENKEYTKMPAKLRMSIIGNPGVDKNDFELWSLAVSAINACGMCIDAHEAIIRKHDVSALQVQAAVRIASTVHAASVIIENEEMLG